MTKQKRKGITAKGRLNDLKSVAEDFSTFLRDNPGTVLSGNLRCAVAQCARDALQRSPQCAHADDHSVKHTPTLPISAVTNVSPALVHLIHAVVNRRTTLNAAWYDKTIMALRDSGLIPSRFQKKQRQALVWSLYCEVVLLTTISHAIHITFLLLDKDVPPLPSKGCPKDPTLLQWWDAIHDERTIRQDPKVAFVPFLKPTDLDINSKEARRLSETTLETLLSSMDTVSLWCGMIFAPEDLEFARYLVSIYQVEQAQALTPFKPLNPTSRCSDTFQRCDIEVLSLAISSAYESKFCESSHSVLLKGTADTHKHTSTVRRQVLQKVCETVTGRPIDISHLKTVRESLESEFGGEFLVEVAGVVGSMEMMTKIGNATGKTPIPSALTTMGNSVFQLHKLVGLGKDL